MHTHIDFLRSLMWLSVEGQKTCMTFDRLYVNRFPSASGVQLWQKGSMCVHTVMCMPCALLH